MFTIEFTTVGSGWATCIFTLDDRRLEMSVSDVADGLGELVEAAVTVMYRQGGNLIFDGEPEVHLVRLMKLYDGSVDVFVDRYKDGVDVGRDLGIFENVFWARILEKDFYEAVLNVIAPVVQGKNLLGSPSSWRGETVTPEILEKLKRLAA